jgi:putative restriction endonuclease
MDEQIRFAAFKWLEEQVLLHGDELPRSLLEEGFLFRSQRVTLVGPQGIWKPKVLEHIPLSITTVSNSPYDNYFTDDGFLIYRYRGTDPKHRDNVGLRVAMKKQVPLIYFHSIAKGKYLAVWPVFIIHDDPEKLSFKLEADDPATYNQTLGNSLIVRESTYLKRHYITANIKQRLHQKTFRERVLKAYNRQCAFCRLRHPELLDAAHIITDSNELEMLEITNGLSLCKIHHAAFDSYLVGVTPEYKIIVREDILKEDDGPMLLHGIQGLHNQKIILPRKRNLWPDHEKLEIRYKKFRDAG